MSFGKAVYMAKAGSQIFESKAVPFVAGCNFGIIT